MKHKCNLSEVMRLKGLTDHDVGKMVGLTAVAICMIRQRKSTTGRTALKLAKALRIDPYILFPDFFPPREVARKLGLNIFIEKPDRRVPRKKTALATKKRTGASPNGELDDRG